MFLFKLKNFTKGMASVDLFPKKLTQADLDILHKELYFRASNEDARSKMIKTIFREMTVGALFMFLYMIMLMLLTLFLAMKDFDFVAGTIYVLGALPYICRKYISNFFESKTKEILGT